MDVNTAFKTAVLLTNGAMVSYIAGMLVSAFRPKKIKPDADKVFAVRGVPLTNNPPEMYVAH